MKVDVCLVAGRRPDLIQTTLDSFNVNLFRHFTVERFIANIDPIFGSDDDQIRCGEIIRSFFPEARISEPVKPGFCSAVKRNWTASGAEFVFHLEDDWLLQRSVTPVDIAAFHEDSRIAQICFNHAGKRWPVSEKGPFVFGGKHRKLLGLPTPFRTRAPQFTTSPSFLRGSFARACASLMDENFDPEKQFFKGVNKPLEEFVSPYLNMVLGEAPDYMISDIGREWRSERGIEKRLVDKQSVWVTTPSQSPPGRHP